MNSRPGCSWPSTMHKVWWIKKSMTFACIVCICIVPNSYSLQKRSYSDLKKELSKKEFSSKAWAGEIIVIKQHRTTNAIDVVVQ